ncbi:UDP-3-O-(3-hydroxymyristoyl)glucosamine N-acyltransferase [Entomobacter blattae]|uniref:UDP-3-O-acylglucosamine N-acyltransferase n=1 Tax=Entomobacter blattae TaxID=2762277 RepID=A0A7H1NSL3_9PROT|nr:UDP-3-O-(3-hydroxymyristoyl)glucosamine N-acyltransferase [Entomobacter blattae]QNT78773.1 UDP-3-O-acylglucosamine N-acyltransferase [Entomobacter blattae]
MHENEVSIPGDERFFVRKGPFSLQQLAKAASAEIYISGKSCGHEGGDHSAVVITGVAPLQVAGQSEISFLDNRRYLSLLKSTKAGVVIVAPAFVDQVPESCVALVTEHPYLAWANVAALYFPFSPPNPGIHPTAIIAESAHIGSGVEIGPYVVIEDNVKVGDGCFVGSHTLIAKGVSIGKNCHIASHVSISHAIMGCGVRLYPGVRIGQDGFGFAVSPNGFVSVPQIGRVIIEDGVEIGANTTIDRGSVQDTVIGAGSRIDNLVQIGHNVKMGKCCIVVSQAGISGSTELEDFVTIAAQAGLIGHIKIGKKARIGAQCGVMSDVEAGSDVIGSPAMPFREFFRNVAALRKLAKKPTN